MVEYNVQYPRYPDSGLEGKKCRNPERDDALDDTAYCTKSSSYANCNIDYCNGE